MAESVDLSGLIGGTFFLVKKFSGGGVDMEEMLGLVCMRARCPSSLRDSCRLLGAGVTISNDIPDTESAMRKRGLLNVSRSPSETGLRRIARARLPATLAEDAEVGPNEAEMELVSAERDTMSLPEFTSILSGGNSLCREF